MVKASGEVELGLRLRAADGHQRAMEPKRCRKEIRVTMAQGCRRLKMRM